MDRQHVREEPLNGHPSRGERSSETHHFRPSRSAARSASSSAAWSLSCPIIAPSSAASAMPGRSRSSVVTACRRETS